MKWVVKVGFAGREADAKREVDGDRQAAFQVAADMLKLGEAERVGLAEFGRVEQGGEWVEIRRG